MTHRRIHLAALMAVAMVWPATHSLAQSPGQEDAQQGQAPVTFNLDFPGGPLSEFLAAVRSAHPRANIVAPEAANDFPIPPMQLRSINLQAAIQLIEGNVDLPTGQVARLGVQSFPILGSFDPAIRVWYDLSTHSPWGELKSSVWSLSENLSAGRTSEDLLGAVQVALATFPVESNIRYHEPTSLLIVRGTAEQLALVDKTLAQLQGDVNRSSSIAKTLRSQIQVIETQLIESRAHLRVAEKRVEVARNEFVAKSTAAEDEIKNGTASPLDIETWLGEAELKLIEAEADFEIAQNELRQISMLLDERKADLAAITQSDDNSSSNRGSLR